MRVFRHLQELFSGKGVRDQTVDGASSRFFFPGQDQGKCVIDPVGGRQGIAGAVLVGHLPVAGLGLSFFSCFLQEHPGAEPEFGEVLFFQRFFHPPGGLLVVGTAGVQGRFLGIVEVVFRTVQQGGVQQDLAAVHDVFHHPLDRVGAGAARGQQGGVRKDVVPLQVILHQGDGPVVVRGGSFVRGFIGLFPAAGCQAEKG